MATIAEETLIGYVTDVQSGSITVSLINDEQGASPIVTIGDEDVLVGQVGSYVLIVQEQTKANEPVKAIDEMIEQSSEIESIISDSDFSWTLSRASEKMTQDSRTEVMEVLSSNPKQAINKINEY